MSNTRPTFELKRARDAGYYDEGPFSPKYVILAHNTPYLLAAMVMVQDGETRAFLGNYGPIIASAPGDQPEDLGRRIIEQLQSDPGSYVSLCEEVENLSRRAGRIEARMRARLERFGTRQQHAEMRFAAQLLPDLLPDPNITTLIIHGEETDQYPVDESLSNANAGQATIYEMPDGRRYEAIEWTDRAVDHAPGSHTICRL